MKKPKHTKRRARLLAHLLNLLGAKRGKRGWQNEQWAFIFGRGRPFLKPVAPIMRWATVVPEREDDPEEDKGRLRYSWRAATILPYLSEWHLREAIRVRGSCLPERYTRERARRHRKARQWEKKYPEQAAIVNNILLTSMFGYSAAYLLSDVRKVA